MNLKFVLCDDNDGFINNVEKIINEQMNLYNINPIVIKFNDYDSSFFDYIKKNQECIVYILDLEMPSETGFVASRKIREHDKDSFIIFLTSHQEAALDLFKSRINALTFINKLDYKDNLIETLKELLNYNIVKQSLIISEGAVTYKIHFNQIIYITKEDRKTKIVTNDDDYYTYQSLEKIKEQLGPDFIKSHRSCIINKKRVLMSDTVNKVVIFDNGLKLDLVSEKFKKGIFE